MHIKVYNNIYYMTYVWVSMPPALAQEVAADSHRNAAPLRHGDAAAAAEHELLRSDGWAKQRPL